MSNQSDADTTPRDNLTGPQRAWVNALRSGKYAQTQNFLCMLGEDDNPAAFCCLGVACELAVEAGLDIKVTKDEDVREYNDRCAGLPESIRQWMGLRDDLGRFSMTDGLAVRNDEGSTFAEIADLIESKPEGLFEGAA